MAAVETSPKDFLLSGTVPYMTGNRLRHDAATAVAHRRDRMADHHTLWGRTHMVCPASST
ncbi:hypothetical protein SXCC_00971 [Gluconacetobacter sp. SXCC-1]|nr:hypothetical protein SXCC_00971 [Gluconacetobacter sp. SXCC-1]